MMLRGLLCASLLLAGCALAQPDPAQAASPQPAASPDAVPPPIRVECTPASHASELIGKHGCVAGRVFRVTTTRNGATHLSLCPQRTKCSFHVVELKGDTANVGDITMLRGRIVAVLGDVREYRGHPEIVVREREQLQVAAGDVPPEFDAAAFRPTDKGIPVIREFQKEFKQPRAW